MNIYKIYKYIYTKDHHKNGTNCLPAWHAMRKGWGLAFGAEKAL